MIAEPYGKNLFRNCRGVFQGLCTKESAKVSGNFTFPSAVSESYRYSPALGVVGVLDFGHSDTC